MLLVAGIQLLTLIPVLRTIESDVDRRARETVHVAGKVFDEVMNTRQQELLTTVRVLIADFGFKQAVASQEDDTIRSALRNHSARIDADIALLLDLDGRLIASSGAEPPRDSISTLLVPAGNNRGTRVSLLGGIPYQTVTVPVRAPITIAWVVTGFQIDGEMAARLQSLTGLEVSFVRWLDDGPMVLASTLPDDSRATALQGLQRSDTEGLILAGGGTYLTRQWPFPNSPGDIDTVLQLSMRDAMASYRDVRFILVLITSLSLIVAVTGAFWLARTVTKPVSNLAAAARRMRAGVYSEPIATESAEEFRDLAGTFNAMQNAISEREGRILYQASHDSLSGLPNRTAFLERLDALMAQDQPLCVLNLAIDRFDRIASTLGHRTSDELIKLVARALEDGLDEGYVLGHLGGNEFVALVPNRDEAPAIEWMQRLNRILRAGVRVQGANISLGVTAGIARFPDDTKNAEELLRYASIARSDAQLAQEPLATYRAGQEEHYLAHLKVVGDFPRAVRQNELRACFQPKICCESGAVVAAEALVRWEHPTLGLLMPHAFVDAIEQAGSIAHLTRWVIQEAVSHCSQWRERGVEVAVAVNLSVDDLLDEYLPFYLLQVIKEAHLTPGDLTLEVTESAIMRNVSQAITVLDCIRDIGFRVSIDDFGTGHSSLAQLKRLPVAELKIDKSFVLNLDDTKDSAIVRSTVELAHQLGLEVVAEGVESADALQQLRSMGCEYAQGFHIARPMPAAEFAGWLARWNPDEPFKEKRDAVANISA